MGQYFYEVYHRGKLPEPYARHVLADSFAFTTEAFLFFVMSRALAKDHWRRFYKAVLLILVVDTVWATFVYFTHRPQIIEWLWTNCAFFVVFSLVLIIWRSANSQWGPRLALAAMLVRTVVDYQYSWDLYFPTASTVAATQVPNVRKVETIVYFAAPLFSQAEWQWNSTLAKKLESEDVEVVLPQESALPMLSGQQQFDAAKLFATNIADIERCNVVVAILDGADPDSGTSWEVGYAHKLGRPIIGIRTDLRSGGDDPTASVNLMLAQSCSKMIVVPPDKRTDIEWLATEISNASAEIIGRSVP